jgi:hypothetical protein
MPSKLYMALPSWFRKWHATWTVRRYYAKLCDRGSFRCINPRHEHPRPKPTWPGAKRHNAGVTDCPGCH